MSGGRRQHFDRGAWLTQRQRLQLPDARPPPEERTAPISDVIPSILKKLHIEDRLWQKRIFEEWTKIVGTQVARLARPGEVNGATLVVYVSHSIALSDLTRMHQRQMLANLQQVFGVNRIRSIRLQLDPDLANLHPPPPRRTRPPGTT